MDIKELKSQIIKKEITQNFFIFKLEDNSSLFVANQYIKAIAQILNLNINFIEDLDSLNFSSLFDIPPTDLNIYRCDELKELVGEYNNLIIITNKTKLKNTNIVEIPQLEKWQIEDYAITNLPGIDSNKIKEFVKNLDYDIFKLDNEISKITPFQKANQERIFDKCINNKLFNIKDKYNSFDIINCIINKNTSKLNTILANIDINNINIMGLYSLLYNNFKNIINIQLNSKATAESLGMTYKQFCAIKYNIGHYTQKQLIDNFKFLLQLDYEIKTGQIDINYLFDYIIINIMR